MKTAKVDLGYLKWVLQRELDKAKCGKVRHICIACKAKEQYNKKTKKCEGCDVKV